MRAATLKELFPDSYVSLTNIVLGAGVTALPDKFFEGCSVLESVEIPECVTTLGDRVFAGCSNLVSITIPPSVTNIGASAFVGCTGMTNVILGSGIKVLPDGIFEGCTLLENIEIPCGVTELGNKAFADCSGFSSVTIPSSVTNIAADAFASCTGVLSVTLETVPKMLMLYGANPVDGTAWIEEGMLDGATVYRSNTIDDNQETAIEFKIADGQQFVFAWKVGSEANYDKLTWYWEDAPKNSISGTQDWQSMTNELDGAEHMLKFVYSKDGSASNDPDCGWVSVKSWERRTATLKELFPDSYANLTNVVLGAGVTSLPDGFFDGCTALADIWDGRDWRSLGARSGQHGLWIVNGWVLAYVGVAPAEVETPAGVVGIASYAFEGQSKLKSVSLPSSLRSIGVRAFGLCTSLEQVGHRPHRRRGVHGLFGALGTDPAARRHEPRHARVRWAGQADDGRDSAVGDGAGC